MQPSLFISHGSPMLALQPGASGPALARIAAKLQRPDAILVVSAHWESEALRVMSNTQPQTWHDFGGFPAELYQVQYPAPGNPQLAADIVQRLQAAGLAATTDDRRPFDHGSWVPLSLLYPDADIPVVQVSLPSRQGPGLQVRIGEALAGLREQNVLLIGSGSITHNLGELNWRSTGDEAAPWALEFRDWMVERLQEDDLTALLDYRRQAPHAQRNHPSDEHLLPLFFARGAGNAFAIEHQGFTLGALGMDIYRFD
ncbi:DODA-type extradiol aromatic ring-opening family dioxygenase [Pseudomonas fulva]|uniref:Extradiol ring-cleavage dioxygenase class III protein subunit B n=1 Tax=Pseudomonas fulva (strain 12-X) TaxID=743720 RepID=F6AH36_PSEF1|nr:class III extradiol ring-cleavage dioxygenase [Pseudomonas fulva]AEF22662.1 Extradiol ring-cleavage dioxygenase class III protein subunit B [Pseudomonas fulva 12-X]